MGRLPNQRNIMRNNNNKLTILCSSRLKGTDKQYFKIVKLSWIKFIQKAYIDSYNL